MGPLGARVWGADGVAARATVSHGRSAGKRATCERGRHTEFLNPTRAPRTPNAYPAHEQMAQGRLGSFRVSPDMSVT